MNNEWFLFVDRTVFNTKQQCTGSLTHSPIHSHIHTAMLLSARTYSSYSSVTLKIITSMPFHKISVCCLRLTEKEPNMQRTCCGCGWTTEGSWRRGGGAWGGGGGVLLLGERSSRAGPGWGFRGTWGGQWERRGLQSKWCFNLKWRWDHSGRMKHRLNRTPSYMDLLYIAAVSPWISLSRRRCHVFLL